MPQRVLVYSVNGISMCQRRVSAGEEVKDTGIELTTAAITADMPLSVKRALSPS